MKKLKLILSLFFIALLSLQAQDYKGSDTREFDLLHTKLDLIPNFQEKSIEARATLTLRPFFYEQDELVLDAKGLIIKELSLNGIKKDNYTHQEYKLNVPLGQKFTRNDTITLSINYRVEKGRVKELPQQGFHFTTKSTQLWTEGETSYNSCWFPTIDQPNEKHTQSISLTVADSITTLSNGLLVKSESLSNGLRKDTWLQEKPHAVYLTMVAAGIFEKVVDDSFDRFEVSYYVEPQFKNDAKDIFGNTPEMITYFETLLQSPYPWAKYSQIAVKEYISGAMENTSATVHGSRIQKNRPQLIDNNSDGIIAHELFHHWFGNLVTCESWANLALNEGFADYSEYLWTANKYGKEEAQWLQITARNNYFKEAAESKKELIRYNFKAEEDLFDSHTYEKGGRVLHMLRRLIGDDAFFQGLHLYLKKHAFNTVEIHDLRQSMEEVTGMDLNWFFSQWFLTKGHPDLFVEHTIENGTLNLYVEQTQEGAAENPFQFPMEVLIGSGTEATISTFWVDELDEEFEIKLEDSLSYIFIDPNANLLAQVDHDKTNQLLFDQFYNSEYLSPRLAAFEALTYVEDDGDGIFVNPVQDEKVRKLVLTALEDSVWQIRDLAVQKLFDYDGEDFLEVEKSLQSLIRTDPKSQVRSSAILAMKNFLNPQNDLLFRNALNDPTYLVQGAALSSILASNPPDADSLVSRFKNVNDAAIFGSIADFIAEAGDPSDLDWFIKRLSNFDDMALYQVFGTFGSYLVQTDKETQLKAIPFLSDTGIEHSNWVIRFQAGQGLMLISDQPEALEALDMVKSLEKDEKALKLYEQFGF